MQVAGYYCLPLKSKLKVWGYSVSHNFIQDVLHIRLLSKNYLAHASPSSVSLHIKYSSNTLSDCSLGTGPLWGVGPSRTGCFTHLRHRPFNRCKWFYWCSLAGIITFWGNIKFCLRKNTCVDYNQANRYIKNSYYHPHFFKLFFITLNSA
jgi:hypothetical protein